MDPISDLFIRIKNAQKAGHETAHIPYSKLKHEITKAFERAGFTGKTERKGKRVHKFLEITLLYEGGQPKFRGVKLISKPSRRLYTPYRALRRAPHGGVVLVSTPKGILTDSEAKKEKVGGQLIAEIW